MTRLVAGTLEQLGLPHVQGKVWTTDAMLRETPRKMEQAKARGAVCVDMECAALAAVAAFRGVCFAQFFWAADNLDAPEWEEHGLATKGVSVSEKCLLAAVEMAQQLHHTV